MDLIESLSQIPDEIDWFIFDQFGVLINGATAYPGAVNCLKQLHERGKSIALLSNSGRRSAENAARLKRFGIPVHRFQTIVTSGEALWLDCKDQRLTGNPNTILFLTMGDGDAERWIGNLPIQQVDDTDHAEAIFLLGIPDGINDSHFDALLHKARDKNLPLFCANPDLHSPRPDGNVLSPGFFAARYADLGGEVIQYGKPHRPIFEQVARQTGASKNQMVMIGDSVHHDINGAQNFGIRSVFVRNGLEREMFPQSLNGNQTRRRIVALCKKNQVERLPDWTIDEVSYRTMC